MTDPVTMTGEQHAVLMRAQKLVEAQWRDPKMGAALRAKAKEMFPEVSIPEDTVDPVVAPLRAELEETKKGYAAILERMEKKDKEEADRAQTISMENALANARKKYSLTDEGFDKMVSRMKETANFTDAEAAAAWVASTTPAPKSHSGPSWAPQDLDLYGSKNANEDYKLLHTNTEAFFDKTVADILNEAAA